VGSGLQKGSLGLGCFKKNNSGLMDEVWFLDKRMAKPLIDTK